MDVMALLGRQGAKFRLRFGQASNLLYQDCICKLLSPDHPMAKFAFLVPDGLS